MNTISVIIPTRNRATLLAEALSSLQHQALPRDQFEVVVVDNGSTDATPGVIAAASRELGNVVAVHAAEPGLHNGRHAGLAAARGDVLVFADDDIEALPTWLASIREAFADPAVAMVGGNNFPLFLQPPPAWLLKLWNREGRGGYKALPALSVIEFARPPAALSPYYVWGCNFAVRRQVLVAAGGFHPDGMPKELVRFRGDGETHVSRYVEGSGGKCVFHPGASVRHKVTPERMTFDYFRQRGFNEGVSESFTRLRTAQDGAGQAGGSRARAALSSIVHKLVGLAGDREVRHALDQLEIGRREGIEFHQRAYRDDAEVRAWVHRNDYF